MAAYEYTALDAGGREMRGVLEGDSARQVRQLLRDQSLLPVAVPRSATGASRCLSATARTSDPRC
jgi:general secretion pathway protein F